MKFKVYTSHHNEFSATIDTVEIGRGTWVVEANDEDEAERKVCAVLGESVGENSVTDRLDEYDINEFNREVDSVTFSRRALAQSCAESALTKSEEGLLEKARSLYPVPRILTVQQVGELLQIPASSVYEKTRVRRGAAPPLPCRRVGKYLRFFEAEVLEWLVTLPQNDLVQRKRRAA